MVCKCRDSMVAGASTGCTFMRGRAWRDGGAIGTGHSVRRRKDYSRPQSDRQSVEKSSFGRSLHRVNCGSAYGYVEKRWLARCPHPSAAGPAGAFAPGSPTAHGVTPTLFDVPRACDKIHNVGSMRGMAVAQGKIGCHSRSNGRARRSIPA